MSRLLFLVLATAVLRALARDVPNNVEDFYKANIVRPSPSSSQSPTPPLSLSLYKPSRIHNTPAFIPH